MTQSTQGPGRAGDPQIPARSRGPRPVRRLLVDPEPGIWTRDEGRPFVNQLREFMDAVDHLSTTYDQLNRDVGYAWPRSMKFERSIEPVSDWDGTVSVFLPSEVSLTLEPSATPSKPLPSLILTGTYANGLLRSLRDA